MAEEENYQLGINRISRQVWEGFLAENGRTFDNSIVKSLVNMYNSFAGVYTWRKDCDELVKLPFDKRKSTSNVLARLVLPDNWQDFEECLSGERANMEMPVQGEQREGVIFKDNDGRYFIEGFHLGGEECPDDSMYEEDKD